MAVSLAHIGLAGSSKVLWRDLHCGSIRTSVSSHPLGVDLGFVSTWAWIPTPNIVRWRYPMDNRDLNPFFLFTFLSTFFTKKNGFPFSTTSGARKIMSNEPTLSVRPWQWLGSLAYARRCLICLLPVPGAPATRARQGYFRVCCIQPWFTEKGLIRFYHYMVPLGAKKFSAEMWLILMELCTRVL